MTDRNDDEHHDASGPIDEHALADWAVHEPPRGFAEAVTAQHFDGPRQRGRSRGLWIAGVATLVAACAMFWLWGQDAPMHDTLIARHIETVELGRAVAVAQPGARLRWKIDSDGSATIHQDAGSVFYRVEPGERFEVKTPTGVATVTGTCFEVDLERPHHAPLSRSNDGHNEMKSKGIKTGALSAALAAATVVTVYEGGVVLANDTGQVDVAAGERGRARPGSAPVRFDPDGSHGFDDEQASAMADANSAGNTALPPGTDPIAHIRTQARDLERMRAEKDAQAEKIAALETRVEELGGAIDSPEAKRRRAKKCATQSRGGGCPFLDPDQETLLEMAKCATVKIDAPGFLDRRDPPTDVGGLARQLGIDDPAEQEKLAAASRAHYEAYNDKLRAMFLELGGDPETAEDASADTLVSAISDQLDPELAGATQRRISQERAGLLDPPAPDDPAGSIEERLLRLQADLGNEFESHVAQTMGSERARELRARQDGWPGSTSVHSSDCIE